MRRVIRVGCAAWLAAASLLIGCASGRNPTPSASPTEASTRPALPGRIEDRLFAPDVVLEHASFIGLTSEQSAAIRADVIATQNAWDALELRLRAQSAVLSRTLEQPRVDEAQAIEQARAVTRIEGELKEAHLRLLLRVKNTLSDAQQRALRRVTAASPPPR